jgi:hypothetical protein
METPGGLGHKLDPPRVQERWTVRTEVRNGPCIVGVCGCEPGDLVTSYIRVEVHKGINPKHAWRHERPSSFMNQEKGKRTERMADRDGNPK